MKTLVLTQAEIPGLLPMSGMIDAMEGAFRSLAAGDADLPLRSVRPLPGERGWFAVMPAALGAAPAWFGLKAIGVLPSNHGTEHDSHPGAVLLFEPTRGRLVAVMDASSITARRTAAVSGLATRLCARPDSVTLAMIGAGVEAYTHLEAMLAVRPFTRVRVWNRTASRASEFAARSPIPCDVSATAEDAVRGADVVCTVTSSREPVVRGAWLTPGTHVNAVGASQPHARELDADAIARARVIVDRRESANAEAGELLQARAEGALTGDGIAAELADVVTGRVPGRTSPAEITLFKSLGLAIEDLAAARALFEKAAETGAGTWLDFGGFKNG